MTCHRAYVDDIHSNIAFLSYVYCLRDKDPNPGFPVYPSGSVARPDRRYAVRHILMESQ